MCTYLLILIAEIQLRDGINAFTRLLLIRAFSYRNYYRQMFTFGINHLPYGSRLQIQVIIFENVTEKIKRNKYIKPL